MCLHACRPPAWCCCCWWWWWPSWPCLAVVLPGTPWQAHATNRAPTIFIIWLLYSSLHIGVSKQLLTRHRATTAITTTPLLSAAGGSMSSGADCTAAVECFYQPLQAPLPPLPRLPLAFQRSMSSSLSFFFSLSVRPFFVLALTERNLIFIEFAAARYSASLGTNTQGGNECLQTVQTVHIHMHGLPGYVEMQNRRLMPKGRSIVPNQSYKNLDSDPNRKPGSDPFPVHSCRTHMSI